MAPPKFAEEQEEEEAEKGKLSPEEAAASAAAAHAAAAASAAAAAVDTTEGEEDSPIDYGMFGGIFGAYDSLVSAIVRPPRHEYSIAELGPAHFNFCGLNLWRQDLQLVNQRGQKLECSHWRIDSRAMPSSRTSRYRRASTGISKVEAKPCIVFLHGNSSSRVAAVGNLSFALSLGVSVFAFDFSGSGRSEGNFVTLGSNEQHDLKVVVEYLTSLETVSCVILWGRSMGAATALLYEPSADPNFVRESSPTALSPRWPSSSTTSLREPLDSVPF